MKRLAKNITAIGGSDLTRKLFGFLSVTYLTRHISVSDFGIVNLGFTVFSYILILSAAGLPSLGTREIARSSERSLIGDILFTRIILTLLILVVTIIGVLLFVTNPIVAAMIILISVTAIPNALFLDWYFQGKESMSYIGFARTIGAIINFVVIVSFVKTPQQLIWVALAAIASDLSTCFVYFAFTRNEFLGTKYSFNLNKVRSLLKQALPLGVGSILAHLSINLAPIVIGIVLTTRSVGLFSAASKLVFFLMLFDRVLATLLLPATSRTYSQEPGKFLTQLQQAQKWVFLLSIPICVGGTMLSTDVIRFIFGNNYIEAAPIFSILLWFVFLTMVHTVLNAGLVATGNEKAYAHVMIISSCIYFSFVILGTLFYGEIGAAIGFIASEIISVLLSRFKLHKIIELKFPDKTLQILISAVAMALALIALPHTHVFITILIGAVTYGIVIFALRALTLTELQTILKRVW